MLNKLPEAVLDERGVMWHRGRPTHEYRDFIAGKGIIPLPDWQALTIAGSDRLTWLHALCSQHLLNLAAGESTEALLLTPNGHITAALNIVEDGEQLTIFVERDNFQTVIDHLRKMQFAARIEIAKARGHVIALAGPAIAHPPLATQALWVDPWPKRPGGTTYTPAGVSPQPTNMALALVDDGPWQEFMNNQSDSIVGALAFEAVRIAAWRPRFSTEVDARAIPPELDWLRTAVHLDKGCYCGQETIARVVNLGRPPRRLVFLHLDGSAEHLPNPGASVHWKGKPVGHITSAVRHPELGPIALALVKRNAPATEQFDVDEVACAQEIIVDPSGESAARPKTRPGAELRGAQRGLQKPKMR